MIFLISLCENISLWILSLLQAFPVGLGFKMRSGFLQLVRMCQHEARVQERGGSELCRWGFIQDKS